MMEAAMTIGTKCYGIRNLVGTAGGQHLHVVHFEEWQAVVGVKRRFIDACFAEALGSRQNPSPDPGISHEDPLGNLDPSWSLPTCRFSQITAREQLPSGAIELRFVRSGCQLVRALIDRQYTFTMAY
jgi:hypothetical protein